MAGFGFRNHDGTVVQPIKCIALAGEANILGKGDAVILGGSSGSIGKDKVVPSITLASAGAGNALYGFIVGFEQHNVASGLSLDRTHRPAETAMYCLVEPFVPGARYRIQADGALAATDVGGLLNLATLADADTVTGISKMQASAASIDVGGLSTNEQMRLLGVVDDGNNAITDSTPDVIVQINNLQTVNASAGL
jgi:hypothetical protein